MVDYTGSSILCPEPTLRRVKTGSAREQLYAIESKVACPVCGNHRWWTFHGYEETALRNEDHDCGSWLDHPPAGPTQGRAPIDVDVCTRCSCIVSTEGIFDNRRSRRNVRHRRTCNKRS